MNAYFIFILGAVVDVVVVLVLNAEDSADKEGVKVEVHQGEPKETINRIHITNSFHR